MDQITDLAAIVQREVEGYAVSAFKAKTHAISDSQRQVYAVLVVPDEFPRKTFEAGIVVMARVLDDKVVIEEDTTDRPLYKELVRAGIPREKIILTYAGEKLMEVME